MEPRVFSKPRNFAEYILSQCILAIKNGQDFSTQSFQPIVSRMINSIQLRETIAREQGVQIPAILYLAVTGICNLTCSYCYNIGYPKRHMKFSLARQILAQAYDLGISLVVVTGGEPLLFNEFFSIAKEMPDMAFLIFSNGVHVPTFLEKESSSPNFFWAISLDGPAECNDIRRGSGTYDAAITAMDALRSRCLPFGFSATVSVENLIPATSFAFFNDMVARGCRIAFLLEQTPISSCQASMDFTLATRIALLRESVSIPIVGFPTDEITYGGCQAARGLVQISPEGYVEPCPAVHIAVDSLEYLSLRQALSNPFLKVFDRVKHCFMSREGSCLYHIESQRELFQEGVAHYNTISTVRNCP